MTLDFSAVLFPSGWHFKDKVLADLASAEGLLLSWEEACLSLSLPLEEEEAGFLGSPYYKGANPIHEDSTLLLSQSAPPLPVPNLITMGISFQHMNLG